MVDFLRILAVFGTGITAGVLFCVALSIVPAFLALPAGRYVETHRLIGRNYDTVMPATVLTTTAACAGLAAVSPGAVARLLFAGCAVLMFGVSVVSHLGNVPINRTVRALDPSAVPSEWDDPRARWRRWNLLRTALAVAALIASASAVVIGR